MAPNDELNDEVVDMDEVDEDEIEDLESDGDDDDDDESEEPIGDPIETRGYVDPRD